MPSAELLTRVQALVLMILVICAPLPAADLPASPHPFIVIAHRGEHSRAPENSLRSFRNAIEAGLDYVEMDVRRTRDGSHVLMHDRTIHRTTDGHGRVEELDFATLRSYTLRDTNTPTAAPERVPSFEEALAACRGRINIYLDFKDGDPAQLLRSIHHADMTRRVLVYCSNDKITHWHDAAPELPLIVSPPNHLGKSPTGLVDWAKAQRVEVLDGSWDHYSPEAVQAAQAAGIRIWPDIQDGKENPEYWQRVLALGFSGVQSDLPVPLASWLKTKGRR
ncbi:MAG: glycerophosphodiester phosphodiesterase family protein [Verrucomicrobiales bacterium]|nr:glycerophosphodiester phosphodiesterase family protein [Verrucomicrobiales bacterium]